MQVVGKVGRAVGEKPGVRVSEKAEYSHWTFGFTQNLGPKERGMGAELSCSIWPLAGHSKRSMARPVTDLAGGRR
jgi:hypothetical protein